MFIQNYLAENAPNIPHRNMVPKYITIHNTGDPGATARKEGVYMKSVECQQREASWHYSVDDKDIVQSMPCDMQCWHAGDGDYGPGNTQSIGVEICEVANRAGAEKNAQLLCTDLMKQWSIPIENIKQHHDWSGKDCPKLIRATPNGWQNFIEGIKEVAEVAKEITVKIFGKEVPGIEYNDRAYVLVRDMADTIKTSVDEITYQGGDKPVVEVK